ncbi:hypothetical protein [Streptomyces sp. SCL15-4]|uniref:hypothetical protein n=1 Tax=Streptomyces sp. SCL15-4 TaxID=2967221 RepID=UPI002965E196|nr:hypothetical protein [Streptomyces sp. SCL15-4]
MTTSPARTVARITADLRPLLPLPPLNSLPAAKARGAECTWCTLRAAAQAYIAHPGPCPQCVYDLKPCPVMQALLTLLLELPR